MILLIRLLPLAVGALEVFLFWSQYSFPSSYPYLVLVAFGVVPVTSRIIAGRQVKVLDLLEKMFPTYILLAALGFALLLAEGRVQVMLLILLAGFASFISLELLFKYARNPRAYPVNGLSHVNLAYVPLIIWYAASTSAGLMIFLHSSGVWHVAAAFLLGVVIFRTTGHPGATSQQNYVWMVVGGLLGLEVGLIGLLLPTSTQIQGLVAAIIFCGILRVRRYLYDPKPSTRTAWAEVSLGALALLVALGSAKWL
ncbi:MAG: hypothetical protein RDU25_02485 [Patescibacteria group bacterium]|nr:hypothetical protein [Patescibacteria group bacterium]